MMSPFSLAQKSPQKKHLQSFTRGDSDQVHNSCLTGLISWSSPSQLNVTTFSSSRFVFLLLLQPCQLRGPTCWFVLLSRGGGIVRVLAWVCLAFYIVRVGKEYESDDISVLFSFKPFPPNPSSSSIIELIVTQKEKDKTGAGGWMETP